MSCRSRPKQTFTERTKVCFDINTNDNIGAGKWINAWIIPTSSVAANGGRFDFADEPALDPEQQAPGPDDFHFKYFDGSLIGPNGFIWWEWTPRASESATRFTQCVEQTAPGQLTYTRDLPVDANGDGVIDPGVAETVTRTGTGEPARRRRARHLPGRQLQPREARRSPAPSPGTGTTSTSADLDLSPTPSRPGRDGVGRGPQCPGVTAPGGGEVL